MAFDLAIDAVREVVKLAAPDYLDGIDWNEASLRLPLAEQEASPRSMRAFQVVDGPVVGLGDFVGPGYEIRQELQIVLRYLHDPRSSEWYDLRKMASTDAARIVERVCRPPVGDYATAGILDIRFVRHDLLAASQQQGCHDQRLTFEVLHYLSATAENIRSLSLRRFSTYTALRAHLVAQATAGQLARLVNGTTLERIADYSWNGTAAVMVGTADLTKVAATSYSATDIAAGSGGTVTLTYGTGVVVATAGATFTAAQESAFDVLHVGTHASFAIPAQSAQWAGQHFSVGTLPASGTADRVAAVISEATGAVSTVYLDSGAAWGALYAEGTDPTMYKAGDVPTVADVAAYSAATLYGEEVAYVTDQGRLYRAGALAQYDVGTLPTYASTAAMLAARADAEYGTVTGDAAYTARVIRASAARLLTEGAASVKIYETLPLLLADAQAAGVIGIVADGAVYAVYERRSDIAASGTIWVPTLIDLDAAGLDGATVLGGVTATEGSWSWVASGLQSSLGDAAAVLSWIGGTLRLTSADHRVPYLVQCRATLTLDASTTQKGLIGLRSSGTDSARLSGLHVDTGGTQVRSVYQRRDTLASTTALSLWTSSTSAAVVVTPTGVIGCTQECFPTSADPALLVSTGQAASAGNSTPNNVNGSILDHDITDFMVAHVGGGSGRLTIHQIRCQWGYSPA